MKCLNPPATKAMLPLFINIISSRAKRACITLASQGQRDFLLVINLSSLVGVRLDVIQSSALWVSRQRIAIDDKAPGFIHEDGLPPNISGK